MTMSQNTVVDHTYSAAATKAKAAAVDSSKGSSKDQTTHQAVAAATAAAAKAAVAQAAAAKAAAAKAALGGEVLQHPAMHWGRDMHCKTILYHHAGCQ